MTGKRADQLHVARQARPAGQVVLETTALSVAHEQLSDRRVLDGVSLRVHAGEVVALAGAMGSGRTALLSTLFGLARGRVSGRIAALGAAFAPRSPREAIARGLALVPEDRKALGLVLGQSVAENLGHAAPGGWRHDADQAEADAAAAAQQLTVKAPSLSALIDTLSGGNQQKVVIAKWLRTRPRLLLLDEPTRGVDVGARAEIFRIIRELTDGGLAVLMASSDLEEIRLLADRVVVLRERGVAGELAGERIDGERIMQLAVGQAEAA
jgi:ABC-type sugar transport system ATPase subunit